MAITSHWVYQCDSGTRATNPETLSSTRLHPTCDPGASGGGWVQLTYDDGGAFDPSTLSPTVLAGAIGAGFISMAIPLVLVFAARSVLRAIKSGW